MNSPFDEDIFRILDTPYDNFDYNSPCFEVPQTHVPTPDPPLALNPPNIAKSIMDSKMWSSSMRKMICYMKEEHFQQFQFADIMTVLTFLNDEMITSYFCHHDENFHDHRMGFKCTVRKELSSSQLVNVKNYNVEVIVDNKEDLLEVSFCLLKPVMKSVTNPRRAYNHHSFSKVFNQLFHMWKLNFPYIASSYGIDLRSSVTKNIMFHLLNDCFESFIDEVTNVNSEV